MDEIHDRQMKIWLCRKCKRGFNTRWLLARHLKDVHEIKPKDAVHEATLSEWWRVYNPNLSKITAQTKDN